MEEKENLHKIKRGCETKLWSIVRGAQKTRRTGHPIRRVYQALKRGPSFLGPLLDYQKAPNVAPSGAFSSRKGIRVNRESVITLQQ